MSKIVLAKLEYPTLRAAMLGKLRAVWELESWYITQANSQLSPVRAGELAAAKLAVLASREQEELEGRIWQEDRGLGDVVTSLDEKNLYEWLQQYDQLPYSLRGELVEFSKTRWLLLDMDDLRHGRSI